MNRPNVTYAANGFATIVSLGRKTEIDVVTIARLTVDGYETGFDDLVALAAGYRAVAAERDALRAELEAARAGTIGAQHAASMQDAREVVACLRQAGEEFMAIYDTGEAPDSTAEMQLRAALGTAEEWLIRDNPAVLARTKVLKGGAQ